MESGLEKQSVTVTIRGHEFRIRTGDDPDELHRIAHYLDETMAQVEERTGTIDSLDVAMLTALNLAREVIDLRGGKGPVGTDPARLERLIDLAESALAGATPAA